MSIKADSMFDKRIIARNIKHQRLSRKEYEQYLRSLVDAAQKACPMFEEKPERTRGRETDDGDDV